MMNHVLQRSTALVLAIVLGTAACNSAAFPPPTEAEIKQTIEKTFTEIYLVNDFNAIADKITFQFGTIQVGQIMEKQMGAGELAQPVYPVKAPLELTVTYSNNPNPRSVERGKQQNDVFFFYRDGFGGWTFRTGSM